MEDEDIAPNTTAGTQSVWTENRAIKHRWARYFIKETAVKSKASRS